MIYLIYDNFNYPFKVDIKDAKFVRIYKCSNMRSGEEKDKYENIPFLEYEPNKIFIGKSPLDEMTKYSGGHGKRFDGNTILMHIENNKYIFIGQSIYSFESYNEIIKHVSPLGNNNVPYPHSIDSKGNYYLHSSDVIINDVPNDVNPQLYYYKNKHLITADKGQVPEQKPVIESDIVKHYIDENQYTLTYHPNPAKNYDRLIPKYGKNMYVIKKDGTKNKITREMYVNIMNDLGEKNNIWKFKNKKIIQERL